MKQIQEQVNIFNSTPLLKSTLKKYINSSNQGLKDTIKSLLESTYINTMEIKDIIVLDTKGNLIASKGHNTEEKHFNLELFNKSKDGTYIHLFFTDDTEVPMIYIAQPIVDKKVFLGVTVFKVSIANLNRMLEQRKGFGKSGEVLIGSLDKNSNVILFKPLRFSNHQLVIQPSEPKKAFPMRVALRDKTNKVVYHTLDYRNIPVIAFVYYYEPLNIGIVAKKDTSEIMEPIHALIVKLIIVSSLSLIVASIISLYIARYFSETINKIVETTSMISEGNLNDRIEITANDELGLLSVSINQMADALVNMNLTLENKVHLQTLELEHANSRLENIFDITPNITLITNGTKIVRQFKS